MQEDVLFCAENIKIPDNLGDVLKEFTKAAIKDKPSPEYFNRWAVNYFATKCKKPLPYEKEIDVDRIKPYLVLVGPSGCGKSSLKNLLIKDYPKEFSFSVSHTTRQPRSGEKDGVDYFFVTRDHMLDCIARNEFIEYAEVHNNLYGTSITTLKNFLHSGKSVILDIDIQGAKLLRSKDEILIKKPVYVFVKPPSLQILEQRLTDRKTDSAESIATRMKNAKRELELFEKEGKHIFDYVLFNDDLETCYSQLLKIIKSKILSK